MSSEKHIKSDFERNPLKEKGYELQRQCPNTPEGEKLAQIGVKTLASAGISGQIVHERDLIDLWAKKMNEVEYSS